MDRRPRMTRRSRERLMVVLLLAALVVPVLAFMFWMEARDHKKFEEACYWIGGRPSLTKDRVCVDENHQVIVP